MNFLLDVMMAEAERVADGCAGMLEDAFQQSVRFRETLEANSKILTVGEVSMDTIYDTSLCSIDGASASNMLQSGDMFSVGSTYGNGQNSLIPDMANEDGVYGSSGLRIHSSETSSIVGSMRAVTEIAVLGDVPHDIAIIDGAMLNNYMSVILAIQQSQAVATPIIEFLRTPKNANAFYAGVKKIFRAHDREPKSQKVIALAKSDSSSTMVRAYLGKNESGDLRDKLVATNVLRPGEIMLPMPLRNIALKPDQLESAKVSSLSQWNPPAFSNWNINALPDEDKDILFRILNTGHSVQEVDANADRSVFNQYTYLVSEKKLHFTYYKPSSFRVEEQALRIEFFVPSEADPVDEINSILPHLEADIVEGAVKEPYSQYMVDRFAKDAVSGSMFMLESLMKAHLEKNGLDAMSALSSYRT